MFLFPFLFQLVLSRLLEDLLAEVVIFSYQKYVLETGF
jgi:hypothetical protein